MNKNIVKLFAIMMMIFVIGSALVACVGPKGDQGTPGDPGKAGAQGPVGEQGAPGFTPYIGENGNWWIDGKDTGYQAIGKDADSIACENHEWDTEIINVKDHTMDSIGVYLRTCVDCGWAEFVRVNHEFVKGETVAPTCQADGYTVYTCACGLSENRDVVAAIDHIAGPKEPVKNEAGICDCEWDNPWIKHCTMCGIVVESGKDGATGHSYTDYNPIKPEGNYNPCTWQPGFAAECDNCHDHVDVKFEDANGNPTQPKGHNDQEYTDIVISGDTAVLSYVCADCGETVKKTITISTDCEVVVTPAQCKVDGKEVVKYNYTVKGEAKYYVVSEKVLPAFGHTVDETCSVKVEVLPSETAEGKISTKCATCGEAVELVLPAISAENVLKGVYMVRNGECDDNYDYYTIALTDKNGEINGAVVVDFKVPASYGHNNDKLGTEAEWIVIDINGTLYDAYWCSTCEHWIAVREHV